MSGEETEAEFIERRAREFADGMDALRASTDRVLLEAVGTSATMNREVWHLTYDAKKALCGVSIHPSDPGRAVAQVHSDHCGNCRRAYRATD